MSEDMVERVENAIRAALASHYGETIGGSEPLLARAAIEALHEPTFEMVRDGDAAAEREAYCQGDDDVAFTLDGSKAVWQAMITAALSTPQPV